VDQLDGFWRGRRVLLTGHSGFKGGWLALWLHSLGARVTGLSLAPQTRPALFDVARIAEGIDSRIGDVRDASAVNQALRSASPEIVFHLAAQALVAEGYAAPVDTYATNVLGTVQILEAVRAAPSVKALLAVTSDKCYDNREIQRGYREDEPLGGRDPYSSSKACAELVTSAYRESFLRQKGVAVASARAGNTVGGGDWSPHRLVPDLVSAFVGGETAGLRRPGAVRPWQHVLDPLAGYLILGQKLLTDGQRFAQAWNFGPLEEDATTVGDFAGRFAKAWGGGARAVSEPAQFPHEAATLRLDATKARSALGWQPRWRLDAAIEATVEWYCAWHAKKDMRSFSLAQIERYCKAEAVA
jgi:CDP-glucose 4,6-dehydratase